MENKTSILGLKQISRTVMDIEQSILWYQNILGFKLLYRMDDTVFFHCGDTRLMLIESHDINMQESVLYFNVRNLHETLAALTAKEVLVSHEPHLIHKHDSGVEEWMAFIEDIEGRAIGLTELVRPTIST